MAAWIYQDPKQVAKHGEAKASHYVGWFDPDGRKRCKSCGPGSGGKRKAENLRKQIEAQLLTGTYQSRKVETWEAFRAEHAAKELTGMDIRNREETEAALASLERLLKPKRLASLTSAALADFVAKRRKERGLKQGSVISPATVNKELRHIKATLRLAVKWKYLKEMPDIDFLKEVKRLPTYIPPDHFAAIYGACEQATLPEGLPFPAADWWRGLLVVGYMTGWRIGAILSLLREDVDLADGTAFSRGEDNKGKRDQKISLHPLVVEHLKALPGFGAEFFPWNENKRYLYSEFYRIQAAAKIKPERGIKHYGFHDLRRAFATLNADRLGPDVLQAMMQHKDYQTTQRYISLAKQLKPAAANLFVPPLPGRDASTGG